MEMKYKTNNEKFGLTLKQLRDSDVPSEEFW